MFAALSEVGGYINITIEEKEYARQVFEEIEKSGDKYGSSE